MLAITPADSAEPEPSHIHQSRIIHFGANFKSIGYEWIACKTKFEQLLMRLWWLSATVHFEPEYCGIQPFEWNIDFPK